MRKRQYFAPTMQTVRLERSNFIYTSRPGDPDTDSLTLGGDDGDGDNSNVTNPSADSKRIKW